MTKNYSDWPSLTNGPLAIRYRAPLANLGFNMGLQGKHLGLYDYGLFEIAITEISFEIEIMNLKSNQQT